MSSTDLQRALMYLDGKLPEGYVAICAPSGEAHSFIVRRLGPSVECPQCGRTALSANLIAAYYERMSDETIVVPDRPQAK
jgi:hypothetical protein